MYDRMKSIKSSDCTWLFSNQDYQTWLEQSDRLSPSRSRLIWIKGKPGAGKSVLMKRAMENAQTTKAHQKALLAGFFFNSRSSNVLEKTTIGLYRSLSHQLVQVNSNAVLSRIKEFQYRKAAGSELFHQSDLQDMLLQAYTTSRTRPSYIFVDALDECQEIEEVVGFFCQLIESSIQNGVLLKVCFSSRHFPKISMMPCTEIVVEYNNKDDILSYIDRESRIERTITPLRDDIAKKSSGVFLWVVLVVAKLKQSAGKSTKALRTELDKIPEELNSLFRDLFRHLAPHQLVTARFLFHLILFARRPLTGHDLSSALAFVPGHHHQDVDAWRSSEDYLDDEEMEHEYLINLSCGLLERRPGKNHTYQVIHESVREFFLNHEGFDLLEPSHVTRDMSSITGEGHGAIVDLSIQCLNACVLASQFFSSSLAFTTYIADHFFNHIDLAERFGISQNTALQNLGINDPDSSTDGFLPRGTIKRLFPDGQPTLIGSSRNVMTRNFERDACWLYNACKSGATGFVYRLISMGADVNVFHESAIHKYALIAASSGIPTDLSSSQSSITSPSDEHAEIVELLLSHGADHSVLDGSGGRTALHWAAEMLALPRIAILVRYGADLNARAFYKGWTPLHFATAEVHGRFKEDTIVRKGLVTNFQIGQTASFARGSTPPSRSLSSVNLPDIHPVLAFLVSQGADIHAKDTAGNTPLHVVFDREAKMHAPGSFHDPTFVIKTLLTLGASLSDENNEGQTPLHLALKVIMARSEAKPDEKEIARRWLDEILDAEPDHCVVDDNGEPIRDLLKAQKLSKDW